MKAAIPSEFEGYPVVTPQRMQEIDLKAIREFGIPALQLMENAGRGVAEEAMRFMRETLGKEPSQCRVTVCCGRGMNGGDGLVAARCLKERGSEVAAFLAPHKKDGSYSPEVQANLSRATQAGVAMRQVLDQLEDLEQSLKSSDLVVDALLGTGSSGKPAGHVHKMIQKMTKAAKPVIAIDLPSGLDPGTGYHSGAIVTAALTCTLGLPKRGLVAPAAQRYVGRLKVLDIGFPKELLK